MSPKSIIKKRTKRHYQDRMSKEIQLFIVREKSKGNKITKKLQQMVYEDYQVLLTISAIKQVPNAFHKIKKRKKKNQIVLDFLEELINNGTVNVNGKNPVKELKQLLREEGQKKDSLLGRIIAVNLSVPNRLFYAHLCQTVVKQSKQKFSQPQIQDQQNNQTCPTTYFTKQDVGCTFDYLQTKSQIQFGGNSSDNLNHQFNDVDSQFNYQNYPILLLIDSEQEYETDLYKSHLHQLR